MLLIKMMKVIYLLVVTKLLVQVIIHHVILFIIGMKQHLKYVYNKLKLIVSKENQHIFLNKDVILNHFLLIHGIQIIILVINVKPRMSIIQIMIQIQILILKY